jgi:uncharacterized protein YndB with AHSA1/START domain
MATRRHVCELELPVPPERVFEILITPSAIRDWWGAARAIVLPQVDGTWAAVWGADEDEPDYIAIARLAAFDPPRRLKFADCQYFARSGPLPFDSSALSTEFTAEPRPTGALLRVVQDGFPDDPAADAFYAACEKGWQDTFAGIRRFLGVLS